MLRMVTQGYTSVGGHRVLLSLARAFDGKEVKLVSVAFPRDFRENIFVVIIPKHEYSLIKLDFFQDMNQ